MPPATNESRAPFRRFCSLFDDAMEGRCRKWARDFTHIDENMGAPE